MMLTFALNDQTAAISYVVFSFWFSALVFVRQVMLLINT